MPVSTIQVARVETLPRVGGTRWVIYPERAKTQRGWTPCYETLAVWKAALCESAKRLGAPLTIVWTETKYGRQIIRLTMGERPND